MTSVIRFPPRRSAVVWLLQAAEGGWLVAARGTAGCTATTTPRSRMRSGSAAI